VYKTVYGCDVTNVAEAGLVCRPVGETVRDTWAWMEGEELKPVYAPEGAKGLLGLSVEKEEKLLGKGR